MDHQSGTQDAHFVQNHRFRERDREIGAYVCCPKARKGVKAKKKKKSGKNNWEFGNFIAYSVSLLFSLSLDLKPGMQAILFYLFIYHLLLNTLSVQIILKTCFIKKKFRKLQINLSR